MVKNLSKIYQRAAFMILVIIISGLLNICLFVFQAKAAPLQSPRTNSAYDTDCSAAPMPMSEPVQSINRPAAPMPECCLAQNRNFNAVVKTATDQSAPAFSGLVISPSDNQSFKNNSTHYTARLIYPPPEAPALASIVIRE